jgi:hypothetical protein
MAFIVVQFLGSILRTVEIGLDGLGPFDRLFLNSEETFVVLVPHRSKTLRSHVDVQVIQIAFFVFGEHQHPITAFIDLTVSDLP